MTTTFTELSPGHAHSRLAGFRIIDVREPHEDGPLGFIEGAELMPLATLSDHARALRGSRPLLLVCRSGRRSARACEILQKLGVGDVTNLVDGMIGWNRASLPVRNTEPRNLTALIDQIVSWIVQVGPLTSDAARAIVCQRFRAQRVSYEQPSHAAIEDLIDFVGESLANVNPPDLDLSLASFRRSLAVL